MAAMSKLRVFVVLRHVVIVLILLAALWAAAIAGQYGYLALLLVLVAGLWAAVLYLLGRALTPRVFISYRRTDTGETADRLWADLTAKYGDGKVFLDKQDIPYGEPWDRTLAGWLGISNVVVALVGHEWDGGPGDEGYPRVLNPYDWVRREVETALDDTSKSLFIVHVVPDGGPEPDFPNYGTGQLDAWGRAEEAKLLERLRGLQRRPTQLGEHGWEYIRGRDALIADIGRKYPDIAWWWYLSVISVMAVLGWLGYDAAHQARQAKQQLDGVAQEQARHAKQLEEQTKAINSFRPAAFLPYSLDGFVKHLRNGPDVNPSQFQGCYVVWHAQYVRHDPPIEGSQFVELRAPASTPPFRVLADVSVASFNNLSPKARASGTPVWVFGVVVECSANKVTLREARLAPDPAASGG